MTALLDTIPTGHPMRGASIARAVAVGLAPVAGSLWERAAGVDGWTTDGRGYFTGWYVYGRDARLTSRVFDTADAARAWLNAPGQIVERVLENGRVLCGHRFTFSGRIYGLNVTPAAVVRSAAGARA